MSDEKEIEEQEPKKKSKLPLVIGLVLALAGGGGGFFAVQAGFLFGAPEEHDAHTEYEEAEALPDVEFVSVDPLVITLGDQTKPRHLRFRAELEVGAPYQQEVAAMMPRILDVLNGYLRAVRMSDLEDPSAYMRLKAQMLRRVQTVTGDGRVRDLLIMEFVLN